MSKAKAFRNWSTMMTMVAITTSCTMILIRPGIIFLSEAITTFDTAITTMTEMAITMAGFIFTVTASAEHIPSTCTVIGLSCPSGLVSSFLYFAEKSGSFSTFSISTSCFC